MVNLSKFKSGQTQNKYIQANLELKQGTARSKSAGIQTLLKCIKELKLILKLTKT